MVAEIRKWVLSAIIIGVLAVGLIYVSQPVTQQQENKIENENLRWYGTLDEGLSASEKTGKNLFVIFSASWCPACQQMEKETLGDERVIQELSRKFVLVKIDTDSNPELTSRYGIYGVPTVIIMDSKGNELKRFEGYRSPDELLVLVQ